MKVAIIFLVCLVGEAVSDCQNQADCKMCIAAGGCSFTIHLNGKFSCEKEEVLDSLALKRVLFSENDCDKFLKGKRLARGEKLYLKPSQSVGSKLPEGRDFVNRSRPIIRKSTEVKIDRTPRRLSGPTMPSQDKETLKLNNVTFRSSPTLLTTSIPGNASERNQLKHVTSPSTLTVLTTAIPGMFSERNQGAQSVGNTTNAYNCTGNQQNEQSEKLWRSLCRTSELIRRRGKVTTLSRDLFMLNLLNPMSHKPEVCKLLKWKKNNCPVLV